KYEFGVFDKADGEAGSDVLDRIERRLLKVEERSLRFTRAAAGKNIQKELRPHIDEYSHLIGELDAYLNKKERKIRLREKWKNFFGKRKREKSPS
ncbi:MAG: hypothetical protein LBG42_02055, partial [Treponema sp.]|nr:hypothetical protein [Treponema sp.]